MARCFYYQTVEYVLNHALIDRQIMMGTVLVEIPQNAQSQSQTIEDQLILAKETMSTALSPLE